MHESVVLTVQCPNCHEHFSAGFLRGSGGLGGGDIDGKVKIDEKAIVFIFGKENVAARDVTMRMPTFSKDSCPVLVSQVSDAQQ